MQLDSSCCSEARVVSASAVILSGSPLKNSWEPLLRSSRGAGECRLLSGPHGP